MSKARLVITAVILEHRQQAEVARAYGVSESWVSKLIARYRAEGEAAYEPRSRRPHTSPTATPPSTVELIIELRNNLSATGLDAGPDTIAWHLTQHHDITTSVATISRYLTRAGLVMPEPKKRPKSSYIRFQAQMPNETWQSDFTHYPLTNTKKYPKGIEIITWLDDCTRYALHVSAHLAITTPIVKATFRKAAGQHGIPASTLTDNGMVYTVRLAGIGRQGGRNGFEQQLRTWHVTQKNSRPSHPTTCGKVERFQQTMKKWLRAQPTQPATITELQALIDEFVTEYNHRRPHRSLPHRATPAALYDTMPKALPGENRESDTHDRIRHDKVDKSGTVTLRVAGQLRHIGIGRTHKGTHVILIIQDLEVRVVNAITGELLRELTIDTNRDYQPKNQKDPNPQ
ncbi:IS481 family transposase [Nocardioides sp. CPCC 206347]|uniref:IS481 family transposase n=1 Tax=unclassified Nocardioides TaxID=2615069 RepID=UPI0036238D73